MAPPAIQSKIEKHKSKTDPFRGFTLIELLVVMSIIAVLMGILMPVLSKARETAQSAWCGSTLRQLAGVLGSYVADHEQRLPYVDSALFEPDGSRNWDADPTEEALYPHELPTVLRYYLPNLDIMQCPSAILGYPQSEYAISYRMASADNLDGRPQAMEQLRHPGGNWVYNVDLKYLNGRRYELKTKDEDYANFLFEGWPLRDGAGEYYLFRDLVNQQSGRWLTPHFGYFNQLYLDLHVELIHSENFHGLTDDRPGD